MGNNNLSDSERILVKVDQNNLIYIDPNSVVDKDGNILPRNVSQENLVMYVNLEADLIPRSILKSDNDTNTLVNIASGTFNFLRNQSGGDYDTKWSDSFYQQEVTTNNKNINEKQTNKEKKLINNFDETGQSFGIESINISIKGANSIPQVNISFIDVRGKTLFESPENSPYNTFFHLPWPIFYLTLKGYYGKAIRYRLHLVKFSTKFNDSTGNFDIQTSFVGSTFAYLNDISLDLVKNAPYMYFIENTKSTNSVEGNTQNTDTQIEITRGSRGYSILKSIYSEYKRKGLVKSNFPIVTLRELIMKAQSLDKILEKEILNNRLNPDIFVGLNDFEKSINYFEAACIDWAKTYLLNTFTSEGEVNWYHLKSQNKSNPENILGDKGSTLQKIVVNNKKSIEESSLFAESVVKLLKDSKKGNSNLSVGNILSKPIVWSERYYRKNNSNGQYEVNFDTLISDINDIKKTFNDEKDKLVKFIEDEMNKIILDKELGLGFEPTVKNIFAVILANADVYVRLMKEVHRKAFKVAEERAKIIGNLSKETKNDKNIYPWPEIKKQSEKDRQNVIAYPGDDDLVKSLQSRDSLLWPEVEFVENYIKVATNKSDPNAEKETGIENLKFRLPNDENNNNTQPLNALSIVNDSIPYIDKSPSSFLYEIWERANIYNLVDSFDTKTIKEFSDIEFINIKNSVEEQYELISILQDKIKSTSDLIESLNLYSPIDRYPYYLDDLPTLPYLIDSLNIPYKIKENSKINENSVSGNYDNLKNFLKTYQPESYRKNIYPFNSNLYLSYIKESSYSDDELKFSIEFEVVASDSLIQTVKEISYVKSEYVKNLFDNLIIINNTRTSVMNTSFFHRQLYYDFLRQYGYGKYAASSYLLLNSLPFSELDDKINYQLNSPSSNVLRNLTNFTNSTSKVKYSSLFREIGSTHLIPYHLICKWGSIYHRYKKYLIEGVDILDDMLDPNNKTRPINGSIFFNNNQSTSNFTAFTSNSDTITYTDQTDVGVHPFYDAIFHQIVNDYNHYDVLSGNTSFSQNVTNKKILMRKRSESNLLNFWTSIVDNSKYKPDEKRYTILPCDGGNQYINIKENSTTRELITDAETFDSATQKNFRIVWGDDYLNDNYDGLNFPLYNQYHRTYVSGQTNTDNIYSFETNYRKIIDLLGTFSPNILDEFEEIFLQFASERVNNNSVDFKFPNVKYTKFQDLLRDIVSVNQSLVTSTDVENIILELKEKQKTNLEDITKNILSADNLIKITLGNPKELDTHILYGFTDVNTGNTLSYNFYNTSQLTVSNLKLINLYLGEDIDGYYREFFQVNNIELKEDNILELRPLILIYAGYRKNGGTNVSSTFKNYLDINILRKSTINDIPSFENRRQLFLDYLISNFAKLNQKLQTVSSNQITTGYNNKDPKIDLYNYFKSFNDKWIGGNSIGQRLLLEEFLFLDKANKDIGDKLYINIDKLIPLGDSKNSKINLYGVISILLQNSGLDMRALPSYVNFYGNNVKTKNRITPSKNVASNIFGTFLEVDYQESTPKIIIQYVGQSSKHVDVQNKKYKFADDSFPMYQTNNNPILITSLKSFEELDLSKSNRAVAFEVSFGDQNQSIFKGIQLDQSSLKNTSESFVVLENIARTESGAGAYNIDVGLFDYYRQASYTCDVTCFGNAMIQPTMFFYLKNIPMFKGSYWITEVTHSIKANNFTTTFKGTRIPYKSLPDPIDSFTSSYRVLFDRIKDKAISKVKRDKNLLDNGYTFTYKDKTYTTNPGLLIPEEDFYKNIVNESKYTDFAVPYNDKDESNIQLMKYTTPNRTQTKWLRARVVIMGGPKNPFSNGDDREMEVATRINGSKVLWKDVKNLSDNENSLFYSIYLDKKLADTEVYNKYKNGKTIFINPITKQEVEVKYNVTNTVVSGLIDIGPNVENYGIGMSKSLMKKLGLEEGGIVYFNME